MFKFELGQTVYYLVDNRVHSAPVLCRMYVEVWRPKVYVEEAASEDYLQFGPWRAEYGTCHGEHHERDLFASREELAAAIIEEKI